MAQLSELRKELRFYFDLLHLVETLKNVAASQYHQLERQKQRFERFMDAFAGFFRVVNLVDVENPLVKVCTDVLGIVVVTSDSGFMGGLNQDVISKAFEIQGELPNDKVSFVVIGDKGANYFSDMGYRFKFFPGIPLEAIYEHAKMVKDFIVNEVLERRMGRVVVCYPRALSFSQQEVCGVNILPCAVLFDIAKESELSSRIKERKFLAEYTKVIVESSYYDMVEYLASVWVGSKIYEIFEDSKLAEFSARAMHLETSVDRIQKTFKKLQHKVFKVVRELIDKQMRECQAAKKLMDKKKARKKKIRFEQVAI